MSRIKVMLRRGSKYLTEIQAKIAFEELESGKVYSPKSVAERYGLGFKSVKREFERRAQSNEMTKIPVGRPKAKGRMDFNKQSETGDKIEPEVVRYVYLKNQTPDPVPL